MALVLAFAALYLIWGSTYLAIRFAIESIPPFTMAGIRFVVAGGLLYGWTRWVRGTAPGTPRHWRSAAVVGGLMLLLGNGAVVWAEQWVPSGLTALLVATVPFWLVFMDWASGGVRPGLGVWLGLAGGLTGMALLVGAPGVSFDEPLQLVGAAVILGGSISWSLGAIISRSAPLPASNQLGSAMQMLMGGGLLLLAGAVSGELARADPAAVTLRSAAALAYLVVFGSIVAFSSYIWLLKKVSAARVGTHAYVNPVVALVLGWALADEPLTARSLVAAAVILTSVGIITAKGGARAAD